MDSMDSMDQHTMDTPYFIVRPLTPKDSSEYIRFLFRRGMSILYHGAIKGALIQYGTAVVLIVAFLSFYVPPIARNYPFIVVFLLFIIYAYCRSKLSEYFAYSLSGDLKHVYKHYCMDRKRSQFWVAELTREGADAFRPLFATARERVKATFDIAPRAGLIIGTVGLQEHTEDKDKAEIRRLSVLSEYRRCRVGDSLAIKLYQRQGYRWLKDPEEYKQYADCDYNYHWILNLTLVYLEKNIQSNDTQTHGDRQGMGKKDD